MISTIRLQHYRSYVDKTFQFSPGVNIIAGPNASGKTNLLESLLVIARGGSYRAKDAELIAFESSWARLDAVLDNEQRILKLRADSLPTKLYELDGKEFKRLSLKHTLPVVLFEPNHLMLLHGSPDQRRAYLDDLLEQQHAGYAGFRRNYRRVLSHRNALLKRNRLPTNDELFPWNLRLSELGALIARSRQELCELINRRLTSVYADISHTKTQVEIQYHHQFSLASYESHMLQKLEASHELDLARGFTAAGPHREDFTVLFDGRPTAETASRGETRTTLLALKILELDLLGTIRGIEPLLLLDDVFSELDASRRTALTSHLQGYQTFITTTDADILSKAVNDAHILRCGD